jgi:hypothetical protein
MSFELNLLKPNPPSAPVVPPVPGMVFIRTVNVTPINYQVASTLSTITVDAPVDATFAKYRAIIFRFYGMGFTTATATDLNIRPRRSGQNITGSVFYQINQVTSTTATGWINTSTSPPVPFTSGTLFTNSYPVNSLNVTMHPVGYDIDASFGSNTTLATGSIVKSTATYPLSAGLSPVGLLENPGLTLGLTSGSNFFAAYNYAAQYLQQQITCDIYGLLKTTGY